MKLEASKDPSFHDIVKFVQKAADAANHPIYSKTAMDVTNTSAPKPVKKPVIVLRQMHKQQQNVRFVMGLMTLRTVWTLPK